MGVAYGIDPFWANQTNQGRTHVARVGVVQDGIQVNVDIGSTSSYAGINWFDLSSNGRNLSLTGSPTLSSQNGGYFTFNESKYARRGSTTLDLSAGVSMEIIFRSSEIETRSQNIFAYSNVGLTPQLSLACPGNGSLRWRTYTTWFGISNQENVGMELFLPNLKNNTWYHVIGTYDSAGISNIYLNGSVGITSTFPASSYSSSYSSSIYVSTLILSDGLRGDIAKIAIYNRPLTLAEVERNFGAMRRRYGI